MDNAFFNIFALLIILLLKDRKTIIEQIKNIGQFSTKEYYKGQILILIIAIFFGILSMTGVMDKKNRKIQRYIGMAILILTILFMNKELTMYFSNILWNKKYYIIASIISNISEYINTRIYERELR